MSKDPSYDPGSQIQPDAGDVGAGNHGAEGVGKSLYDRKTELEYLSGLKSWPDTSVNKFTEHFE